MRQILAFLNGESGLTAVEYAVILALILMTLITVIANLGTSAMGAFSEVSTVAGG